MTSSSPSHPSADRNLLFGILALQLEFIGRDTLIQAMHAWVLDKARPLGQILVEQQALSEARRTLLEALVQEHVRQHGNDPGKSLASLSPVGPVCQELEQIADQDVQASLPHISAAHLTGADLSGTHTLTVGTPTSSGLRFRILRPHARGGLGIVYLAQDEELHREVALKEIRDEYADAPESRARFLGEAEITGGLEHPGIVPVYGLGAYADGRPFYAMRFVRGDSLKDAIERFHRADRPDRDPAEHALQLRQLLGRFLDVCNAIAYAHSRGMLHRDIKPGNILLGPYGETLVVDWGLAKPLEQSDAASTRPHNLLRPTSPQDLLPTQAGQVLGTPAFMSPEQAAGHHDQLGPATDVYSLGATLYCLLTGRPPIGGTSPGEILRQVQQGAIPPVRHVKPDVPAVLDAICRKALALRPEDRYPTPTALVRDLEHWLAEETLSPGGRALLAEARERETAARLEAEEQAVEARNQRQQAERERDEARLHLYVANMQLAQQSWRHNHVMRVLELLEELRPLQPEGNDLRGFEWYHLWRLCQQTARVLRGHTGAVRGAAFSPDGQHLASAGDDATVRIWETATGEEVQTLRGHAGIVWCVSFRPDGRRLASGGLDGKVVLWDTTTWKEAVSFQGQGQGICDVRFSPDGQRLATSGLDGCVPDEAGEVRIGEAVTGRQLLSLRQRLSAWSVAFSPDGRHIASGDFGTVRVWDATTGREIHSFQEVQAPVKSVAFSPDGRHLISATCGTLKLRETVTGTEIWSVAENDFIEGLTWSPDAQWIASSNLDGAVRLHAPDSGKVIRALKGHVGRVSRVAFSPDGKRLASAGDDETVRVWATSSIKESPSHVLGSGGLLQLSQDGARILLLSPDEDGLEVRDTADWKKSFHINLPSHTCPCVTLDDDGGQIGLGDWQGRVRVWETSTGSEMIAVADRSSPVTAVALSRRRSLLAVGDLDGTVKLQDLRTARELFHREGLMGFAKRTIPGLAENLPLPASPEESARLTSALAVLNWHLQQAEGPASVVRQWEALPNRGHSIMVLSVVFSPDGRHVASVASDGTLTVWDVDTGVRRFDFKGHRVAMNQRTLTFSPDGQRLVAVREDHTVKVWDVHSGGELYTLRGHLGSVNSVAASPDGQRFATGGMDRVVKLWEAAAGKEVFSFEGQSAGVQSVAFSVDGRRLLSVGEDGAVMVWETDISSARKV
jgi:WD40 repeat protein/serine/threonine protein kinase